MKYKMIGCVGEDVEEFLYLVGQTSTLRINTEQKTVGFDDLTILVKSKREDGDKMVVKSKLGNTFTFRKVA